MVLRPVGPALTGRPNLDENWFAIPPETVGVSPPLTPFAISDALDEIVAIGVTTPDLELALDIRFGACRRTDPGSGWARSRSPGLRPGRGCGTPIGGSASADGSALPQAASVRNRTTGDGE